MENGCLSALVTPWAKGGNTSGLVTDAELAAAIAGLGIQQKANNIESISATKTLTLSSEYYQFLTPSVSSVIVKYPPLLSTDKFECEILNAGDGTNELSLQEDDGTQSCFLSASVELRGVRVYWDGANFRVTGVSYYG